MSLLLLPNPWNGKGNYGIKVLPLFQASVVGQTETSLVGRPHMLWEECSDGGGVSGSGSGPLSLMHVRMR